MISRMVLRKRYFWASGDVCTSSKTRDRKKSDLPIVTLPMQIDAANFTSSCGC